MKLYMAKNEAAVANKVVLDDMILTKEMPTAAGSHMLEGFVSLFDATVVEKLKAAGYSIAGKANVGEFSIDLMGETSYFGGVAEEGRLVTADAKLILDGEAEAAIVLDVNGTPRRAAAQNGLIYVKPTYGTVSRYGTVPVVCSGETVGVMAKTVDACSKALDAIVGHDDKDGTSHAEELCAKVKSGAEAKRISKVAVLGSMKKGLDEKTAQKLADFEKVLKENGVDVCEIDGELFHAARVAWNILMTAELCNNVSRYDGIKYGYRSKSYKTIGELYTNSRTEAFGELLKTAILFGSDRLSTENYMSIYDKALRVRRVIANAFAELFKEYDAVLMPQASKESYCEADVQANKYLSFEENLYTAPASITGLPSVVVGGVALVGPAFSEQSMLEVAKIFEKGGK